MRTGAVVVSERERTADRRSYPQPLEGVARHVLRAHRLLLSAAVKDHRTHHLRAHREQVDQAASGGPKPQERGVVERFRFRLVGSVRGKGEIDQLFRLAHRQRPQHQRIDQRECRQAPSQGQGDGQHRRCSDDGMFASHTEAQREVTEQRVQPRQQLDVAALLTESQRASESAPRFARRVVRRHAVFDQATDALPEMELELLIELLGHTIGPPHVHQPRQQGHRRDLRV